MTKLVLRELLDPKYESGGGGRISPNQDPGGVPRCHRRLSDLRSKYLGTFQESHFPSHASISSCFLLMRMRVFDANFFGESCIAHNKEVDASGWVRFGRYARPTLMKPRHQEIQNI